MPSNSPGKYTYLLSLILPLTALKLVNTAERRSEFLDEEVATYRIVTLLVALDATVTALVSFPDSCFVLGYCRVDIDFFHFVSLPGSSSTPGEFAPKGINEASSVRVYA